MLSYMSPCIFLLALAVYGVVVDARGSVTPPASMVGIMTDNMLFQSINLNLPQLSKVKAYYVANNITEAKAALVAYLKSRTYPKWYYDPLHPNKTSVSSDTKACDQIVQGNICIVDLCYKFPNGSDFNWAFNPTYNNPNIPYDPEWQWQLGRVPWWSTLGSTWWATNNTQYAQTFVDQMISWVMDCPMPNSMNNSQWSSWRTIEAGIRMGGSWPDAYNRFLTAPQFNESAVIIMLKSFLDHGNYLYKYHTSGNWETMEMNGLFTVGSLFPEFSDAPQWRKFAAQSLYELSRADFLPDGMWNELTTGYMQVSIQNIAETFSVAQVANTSSDLPSDFVNILQKAYEYNVKIMCPIGDLPYVNDAWENSVVSLSRAGLAFFPTDPYLIWAASNRTKGSKPSFTSIFLNSSNYMIMRTGWGFNDTYALLDVAALGARHYHQDKLNLIIDVYGRRMMYDGGGGEYEVSKFRDFAIDTASHNTIMVDGQPQRRVVTDSDPLGYGNPKTPPPVWNTTTDFDYGVGFYIDKYGSTPISTHRREVMFLKTPMQAFVVVDTLTPNDAKSHNYTALWNLLSTQYSKDANMGVYTTDTGKPNLAVVPLITSTVTTYVAVNTSKLIMGWDVDRNPPFQIPALEIAQQQSGSGEVQFVTLILPLTTGQPYPVKFIKNANNNDFVVGLAGVWSSMEIKIGVSGKGGISISLSHAQSGKVQVYGN